MSTTNGLIDNGVVIPASNITWADLANSPYGSWAQWTSWNGGDPKLPLTYVTDSVDFGSVSDLAVDLELDYTGTLTLTLQHSEDNASFTDITVNASSSVAGFRARFVRFSLSLTGTDVSITKILATLSNVTQEEVNTFESNDLEGTVSAREIPLQKEYSKITAVLGTSQTAIATADDYVATDYVATDYVGTLSATFVCMQDIDNTDSAGELAPTFAVFNKDGDTANAKVFVQVIGLPKMATDTEKQISIQRT